MDECEDMLEFGCDADPANAIDNNNSGGGGGTGDVATDDADVIVDEDEGVLGVLDRIRSEFLSNADVAPGAEVARGAGVGSTRCC